MTQQIFTTLTQEELQSMITASVQEALSQQQPQQATQPTKETILNREEVCRLFGISGVTLCDWQKKGMIPYHKMNRRVYFKQSEVMEALEASSLKRRNRFTNRKP